MKNTFIKKIGLRLALIITLVFMLFVPMTTTTSSAATGHNCFFFGEMSTSQGIGQTQVDMLIANRETPENMGLEPQADPYLFYLTEDVSWDTEFVAPEGLILVICLNGHTATGAYNNENTSGGLFFLQCAIHNCAQEDEMTLMVGQEYFDAMLKVFQNDARLNQEEGEEAVPLEIDADMFIALGEDVTLGEEWGLTASSSVTVCTNGYTLTGLEYLTKNGAKVDVIDCSKLHSCYYFDDDGMGVGQQNVDFLLAAGNTPEAWGMPAREEPYYAYLYEDISWEGTLSAPDGVYIALCLNGHKATGNIDNSQTENGGIFLMQCGIHACPVTGETTIELSQGFVALMEITMAKEGGPIEFENNTILALNGDITLTNPDLWAASAGTTITFCTGGYTIHNIEYLRAGGANIQLLDCSHIGPHSCEDLNGAEAEYLTAVTLYDYVDRNSGLFTKTGKQTLCLLGNIQPDKTIVIPSGCDVTLCLNGYTLYSPCFREGQDNGVAGRTTYTAIQILEGAHLTVCDCSEHQTGSVTLDVNSQFEGWNGLGASAIINLGTLTIKGGNFLGIMAILNAGEIVMDGGNVMGLLTGITQGLEMDGLQPNPNVSVSINGGEVHSAAFGIVAAGGDIIMNGGEITASFGGIASGIDNSSVQGDAVIYLYGGTINVGHLDYKAYQKIGIDVKEDTPLSMSYDTCVGVTVATQLIIGGDVLINIEGPSAEEADITAEILLGDGATINSAEDMKVEKSYEVCVDDENAVATVDPSIADHVTPSATSTAKVGEDGTLTIIPNSGESVATATVYGYALSLKGEIIMSLYVHATEDFKADENARVVLLYKGVKTEYSLADAEQQIGDYYVFTIAISAKDYQKQIRLSFKDSYHVWAGVNVTVNKYLNTIINDTTGTYDKEKDVAIKMQNYCMAASYHFEVSSEYLPNEEIQTELNNISRDTLAEYAATQEGQCEDITFAGVSLFLQANTTIRFYFYLNKGKTLNDVTLTVDGKPVQAIKDGSAYYFDIEGITAQDLGKRFTINLDGMVVTYCAISYSYSILNTQMRARAVTQDSMIDIAKSLYAYYKAAYDYFNPQEGA